MDASPIASSCGFQPEDKDIIPKINREIVKGSKNRTFGQSFKIRNKNSDYFGY
jgi:hypothetical protein